MLKHISVLSLFTLSFSSFLSVSYAESLEEILNQPNRPTMEQLIPIFEKLQSNPFPGAGGGQHVSQLTESDTLQKAIVAMEKAFPGATFYELGRDAVHVGDALDAFYLSLGQKGRVKRLDASHPSFRVEDPSIVYDFLKTNGMDLSKIQDSPPHIVFDITSFSKTNGVGGGPSQSVRVMRAMYEQYKKMGKDPKDLIPKVNFVSIGGFYSGRGSDITNPDFDFEKAFKAQRDSVKDQEFASPLFTELSPFNYTAPWHEIFEAFKRRADGTVTADTPLASSTNIRKGILSDMYETWRAVGNTTFRETVKSNAILRGYEFPESRTETLKPASKEAIAQVKEQLRIAEEQRKEAVRRRIESEDQRRFARKMKENLVSPEGQDYLRRYELARKNGMAFLKAAEPILADLPTQTRLTNEDMSAILKTLLYDVEDSQENELVQQLAKIAKANPKLSPILSSKILSRNLDGSFSSVLEYRVEKLLNEITPPRKEGVFSEKSNTDPKATNVPKPQASKKNKGKRNQTFCQRLLGSIFGK